MTNTFQTTKQELDSGYFWSNFLKWPLKIWTKTVWTANQLNDQICNLILHFAFTHSHTAICSNTVRPSLVPRLSTFRGGMWKSGYEAKLEPQSQTESLKTLTVSMDATALPFLD